MTKGDEAMRRHPPGEVVSINVPANNLGDFLASILGTQRSATKLFDQRFSIDKNWIFNIVHLIQQRLASQNIATLIKLNAKFNFANNKQYEINNIEQLFSFNDVSDDISTGFRISMTYIVKFPYRDSPETQEIIVSGISSIEPEQALSRRVSFGDIISRTASMRPYLRIAIKYTDVSWCEDILNIISNHINSSFKKRDTAQQILRNYLSIAAPMVAFVGGMASVFYSEQSGRNSKLNFLEAQRHMFDPSKQNQASIGDKINFFYEFASFSESIRPGIGFLFAVMSPFVAFFFLLILSKLERKSYVALNEKTKIFAIEDNKRITWIYGFLTISILCSIATGVAGNFLYSKIS
jgi:hypothetical protein